MSAACSVLCSASIAAVADLSSSASLFAFAAAFSACASSKLCSSSGCVSCCLLLRNRTINKPATSSTNSTIKLGISSDVDELGAALCTGAGCGVGAGSAGIGAASTGFSASVADTGGVSDAGSLSRLSVELFVCGAVVCDAVVCGVAVCAVVSASLVSFCGCGTLCTGSVVSSADTLATGSMAATSEMSSGSDVGGVS